jgi:hypothetical protein
MNSESQRKYIDNEVFEFKTQQKRNQNTITRLYKGPHQSYDVKSSAVVHGAGSQVYSQSSGSPLGHTFVAAVRKFNSGADMPGI